MSTTSGQEVFKGTYFYAQDQPLLAMTTRADGHTCAVIETQWERLYRIVELRRTALDLTLASLQAEGGPSPKWVQKLRTTTGQPTPRMRSSMQSLDRALQWPLGTSWSLVGDDRSAWSDDMLLDEEHALLDVREVEPRPATVRKMTDMSKAFAAQLRAERAATGLTQDELARASGVAKSAIQRIEAEQAAMDTAQMGDLCRALGISILDFVMAVEDRLARERGDGAAAWPARRA